MPAGPAECPPLFVPVKADLQASTRPLCASAAVQDDGDGLAPALASALAGRGEGAGAA